MSPNSICPMKSGLLHISYKSTAGKHRRAVFQAIFKYSLPLWEGDSGRGGLT